MIERDTQADSLLSPSYVIEDGSPFMRSGKQNQSSTGGRGNRGGGTRDVVDDLGDDVWNFMSFCKKDFVKDSIPDQQLSLDELTLRYKGEDEDTTTDVFVLKTASEFLFGVAADTKKSVLKTMAAMDLDKINMDLVENLLEWIVDGKHNYPPGKNQLQVSLEPFRKVQVGVTLWPVCVSRGSAGVSAWSG